MTNSLTFPVLRLLADGQFHSGEKLARHFNVTRATIWNAIKQAQALDIQVFSVRGKGYRLPEKVDFIDRHKILATLGDTNPQFDIQVHDSIDSSNSLLVRLATEGAQHGCCIVAELQRSGRGRRGRIWHSTLGASLTFSLLWRFTQCADGFSGLSLAVGIALVRAMDELAIPDIYLKWPNDVLYQDRKLAGILIELQGEMLGASAAVIGVGINLKLPDKMKKMIDQAVVDLSEIAPRPIDRNQLLAVLLKHLATVLETFAQHGFICLIDEWKSRHAFHRRQVKLLLPDGHSVQALVMGVAEDGALLADVGHGVQRFSSAEISMQGNT